MLYAMVFGPFPTDVSMLATMTSSTIHMNGKTASHQHTETPQYAANVLL